MSNLSHNIVSLIRGLLVIAAAVIFIHVSKSHNFTWLGCGIVFFYALLAMRQADATGRQIGIATEIGHQKADRLIKSGKIPLKEESLVHETVELAERGESQQCTIDLIVHALLVPIAVGYFIF